MSDLRTSAIRLADEWLAMFSDITWEEAAASIRRRAPAPCGETPQICEAGKLFDVSDSWRWVAEPERDIRVVVEVFDCTGSGERLVVREALIPR